MKKRKKNDTASEELLNNVDNEYGYTEDIDPELIKEAEEAVLEEAENELMEKSASGVAVSVSDEAEAEPEAEAEAEPEAQPQLADFSDLFDDDGNIKESRPAESAAKLDFSQIDEGMHPAEPLENPFIKFKNVKKTYIMGETQIRALDGVNFEIKKGEFVIVVGASGAGKSTILNILGGMDSLTSGDVYVDGRRISEFNQKELIYYRRYDVGFVFQFYNLVQNLTALENVELAAQVSLHPLDIASTINSVGLASRANNFPSQLSGGEQQRVAIARALAKNPKLLLCDEPTGALDYNTGKAILQLLQDTARRNGMTVIIITHNYSLTSVGDRVIKVKNGKIESVSCNDHPMDIRDVEW